MRSMQANITIAATSGEPTTQNVISGTEEMSAAMELSRLDPDASVQIQSSPTIRKLPECRDSLCSPGEARTSGETEPPPFDCPEDCPILLGPCPSPGTSELGDATLECGGLGSCARASLTCVCFAGFDGEACGYCAEGFRRVGDTCEVIASLIAPQDTPGSPPSSPPVRSALCCLWETHRCVVYICTPRDTQRISCRRARLTLVAQKPTLDSLRD